MYIGTYVRSYACMNYFILLGMEDQLRYEERKLQRGWS